MAYQNFIRLNSVGSAIETNSMNVHPINADDSIDTNNDVAVYFFDLEVDDDWMGSLSDDDVDLIHKVLETFMATSNR